jgi:hypothetical protein
MQANSIKLARYGDASRQEITYSELGKCPKIRLSSSMTAAENPTPEPTKPAESAVSDAASASKASPVGMAKKPREIGGPKGPEPTRYGDWEHNGRCTDF